MALTIDSHVHLFGHGYLPSAWHDATAWRWAARQRPPADPSVVRDRIEDGLVDPDGSLLRDEMDRVGLDAVMCIALDWGVALGEPQVPIDEVHEHYRRLQSGEAGALAGRFFTIAGLDPRRENAADRLRTLIGEHDVRGYKLYPPCGYHPYDEVCRPLYEVCREHDVPVVVHTATVGYPMRTRFAHPHAINDVQVEFPELRIVLAHAGFGEWEQAARGIAARHPNTYLELSNFNELVERDPEHLLRSLLAMRDAVGPERILFGSDHFGGRRFSGREQLPAWIRFVRELPERARRIGASVSEEEVELILGENARALYGLSEVGSAATSR